MKKETRTDRNNENARYREVTCPACNTDQTYLESILGQLGMIEHFKCRYCGALWSHEL